MMHALHSLSFLLVFCSVSRLVSAVPSSTSNGYRPNLERGRDEGDSLNLGPSYRFQGQTPLGIWPRLRDAVVGTIWGEPERDNQKSFSFDSPSGSLSSPAAPSSLQARYGNDVVLRFSVDTPSQVSALREASNVLFLDVWSSTDEWVDIRLAKDVVPSLLGLLPSSLQNAHAPLIHDLAQTVYESYPSSSPRHRRPFSPTSSSSSQLTTDTADLFFQDYRPLSAIAPWMQLMRSMFPTFVQVTSVGKTFEGRDMPALRIGARPINPARPRKTIVVAGGAHAREWISVSSVNYIAHSLLTSYGKSRAVSQLLDEFDWVFVPTLNPDGYAYTWEADRLWRKNRQETHLPFCRGLDLDRSFGFEWQGQETSSNPCSESYAGDGPFEAVESNQFAEWAKNEVENNNVEFVGYLDLHSYSQQILYPYSFSCLSIPPTLENLEELAAGMAKAIRHADREPYDVSSACEGIITSDKKKAKDSRLGKGATRIESTGGSALDWFYHELHVPYAYQIKLRDKGTYGFMLPKENIVPTGKEVFNAALVLGKFLLGNDAAEINWDAEFQRSDESQGENPLAAEIGNSDSARDDPDDDVLSSDPPEDGLDDDMDWSLRRRR